MAEKKKSWKTTVSGVSGGLGVILIGVAAGLDGDPETVVDLQAILGAIGTVLAAFGVTLGGVFARDNGVSSEDAGAK